VIWRFRGEITRLESPGNSLSGIFQWDLINSRWSSGRYPG